MEKSNLIWETIKYSPGILFSLEPVMKGLRTSLSHDMSHFHYFLESQFGYTNVRASDFASCKSLLKSELDNPGLLFYKKHNPDPSSESVFQLKSYNCYT